MDFVLIIFTFDLIFVIINMFNNIQISTYIYCTNFCFSLLLSYTQPGDDFISCIISSFLVFG